MAMTREAEVQGDLVVTWAEMPRSPGHAFYDRLQTLLIEAGFARDDDGVLPSLLDPIDMSRRFQNLELYVSPALRLKYPGAEEQFTVTRADGDQDRPNESYLGIC